MNRDANQRRAGFQPAGSGGIPAAQVFCGQGCPQNRQPGWLPYDRAVHGLLIGETGSVASWLPRRSGAVAQGRPTCSVRRQQIRPRDKLFERARRHLLLSVKEGEIVPLARAAAAVIASAIISATSQVQEVAPSRQRAGATSVQCSILEQK